MLNKLLNLVCTFFLIILSAAIQAQWGNPLVYYHFDESSGYKAVDSSGHNFDCIANCDNCWDNKGKFNGAFHFQGTQKIDLPAKEIALSNEKGTVAFWALLPESSANSINCIWWAGKAGGDMFGPENEMHICTEAGLTDKYWAHSEVAFDIIDSIAKKEYFIYSDPWKGPVAATTSSENAISLADNTWHHVACSWEAGGTVALYIDGETIWNTTLYNPNLWNCNIMTIGAANQRSNRRLIGYLDEFRIYDVVLNEADIVKIYNYVPENNTNSIKVIKKQEITLLNCFPNPSDRNISFFNPGIENIEIFSLTGEKLTVQQLSGIKEIVDINIDMLSSGYYIIRAYNNNKPVAVGKFAKK